MKRALATLAFLVAAWGAQAHQIGCDGKPVPPQVKQACCGDGDAHRIDVGDVRHDDDKGIWHIKIGSIEILVPDKKMEPSPDGCYWLFWPWQIPAEKMGANVPIYCFLGPLDL